MGIPTDPIQPLNSNFKVDGVLQPPQIEWVHNTPTTTKHLPLPDSSWLQSISYDSSSLRMTVTTKSGASWQHAQVYPTQFEEMQLHPSKGSYYAKNIKGQHPSTTVIKIPKVSDYPKGEHLAKPKDRFQTPTNKRYKIKGRYQ